MQFVRKLRLATKDLFSVPNFINRIVLGEDTGDGQTIEIGFHQSLWSGLWEEDGVNI